MMRRVVLIAGLITATFLVFAGPAHGQSYAGITATASTTDVAPGGTITISGAGATPNCTVAATENGTRIGSGTASSTGSFSFSVTVLAAVGTETVTVGCEGSSAVASLTLTVGAAPPGPVVTSPGGLARTGSSDAIPATTIAIGLITAGAVVLGLSRRRRHSKTAA
jgi:hypothetical protein